MIRAEMDGGLQSMGSQLQPASMTSVSRTGKETYGNEVA